MFDLNEADREWVLRSFEVQVAHHPIDAVFVGLESGEFWMVRRGAPRADGSSSSPQRVVLPPLHQRTDWVAPEPRYQHFDPRERPWYRPDARQGAWTDVYLFRAGYPGITVSVPIVGQDGVLGVVGVDLALSDLVTYVSALQATPHSEIALLDAQGRVVASEHAELSLVLVSGASRDDLPEAARDLVELLRAVHAAQGEDITGLDRDGTKRLIARPAGREPYYAVLAPLGVNGDMPQFHVVVAVPERDVLGPILDNRFVSLVIVLVTIAIAVLIAIWITRGIARPLELLEHEMARVQTMDLAVSTRIPTAYIEVENIVQAFDRMIRGLHSFSRYVPREVVRDLLASGRAAEVGGEERELSVFFSDIAGFTADSEKAPAREVFEQLAAYFEVVASTIREHGGTLDKYIGDAVMAFWNAPLPVAEHATRCALAALDVQQRLTEAAAGWASQGKPRLRTRIGLTTARVMVGNVGSHDRLNYTALGDGVNLASRLEGANKLYGTAILADEGLVAHLDRAVVLVQWIDTLAVAGRQEGVRVYEVVDRAELATPERVEMVQHYEAALESYTKGAFADAAQTFALIEGTLPGYAPATRMRQRCEQFQASPPPDWTGVFRAADK